MKGGGLWRAQGSRALTGAGRTAPSDPRSWAWACPGHTCPGSSSAGTTSARPPGSGADRCGLAGIRWSRSDCEGQTGRLLSQDIEGISSEETLAASHSNCAFFSWKGLLLHLFPSYRTKFILTPLTEPTTAVLLHSILSDPTLQGRRSGF